MPTSAEELADAYAANAHQEAEEHCEAYAPPTILPEEVVHRGLAPPIRLHHVGVISIVGQAHLAMQQAVTNLAIGVTLGAAVNVVVSVKPRWAEVDAKLLPRIEVWSFWRAARAVHLES